MLKKFLLVFAIAGYEVEGNIKLDNYLSSYSLLIKNSVLRKMHVAEMGTLRWLWFFSLFFCVLICLCFIGRGGTFWFLAWGGVCWGRVGVGLRRV